MSKDITITGTENIRTFTIIAVAHGLALEINTGMIISHFGSALKAARVQRIIGPGRTTRKAALKAAVKLLKDRDPEYVPSKSIVEALAK